MGKKAFGLDISDASIEALELQLFIGKYKIKSRSRLELDSGIVQMGEIKKPKELQEAVKKLLSSATPSPIKANQVVFSLPESRVITRIFQVPATLKEAQLDQAVKNEAESTIPIPADDLYTQWHVLNRDKEHYYIQYLAVSRQLLDSYLDLFKTCSLKPIIITNESTALANALNLEKDKATAIVDIGSYTTQFAAYYKAVRHSASIAIGGDTIFNHISGGDEKKAGKILKQIMQHGLDAVKQDKSLINKIQEGVDSIAVEIKKQIEYYNQKHKNKISSIIITGGVSNMPKIDEYLSEKLELSVALQDPFQKIEKSEKQSLNKAHNLFINVLGLAKIAVNSKLIKQVINLLPKK